MSVNMEKSLTRPTPFKLHDCTKESIFLRDEKGEYKNTCRICGKDILLWFNLYLNRGGKWL